MLAPRPQTRGPRYRCTAILVLRPLEKIRLPPPVTVIFCMALTTGSSRPQNSDHDMEEFETGFVERALRKFGKLIQIAFGEAGAGGPPTPFPPTHTPLPPRTATPCPLHPAHATPCPLHAPHSAASRGSPASRTVRREGGSEREGPGRSRVMVGGGKGWRGGHLPQSALHSLSSRDAFKRRIVPPSRF